MQHDYKEYKDTAEYDEKDQIWILATFLPFSAQIFLLKMGKKKKIYIYIYMDIVRAARSQVDVVKQCVHRHSAEHHGVTAT